MYLYFDKKGTLKEIINDDALRQGNYNVNKMYVYVDERPTYTSIDAAYLLPNGTIVGPMNFNTFETAYIPFDAKRDLRFFKYNQQYRFCVIDLSQAIQTADENILGASALDEAGVVHCDLAIMMSSIQLALGEINFTVEKNSVVEQGVVGSEEYLSLSNYYYLRMLMNNGYVSSYVPYIGATSDLNLGNNSLITSKHIHIQGSVYDTYIDSRGINITANNYDAFLDFPVLDTNETETLATREWATSNCVPYTGATDAVDLGENNLYAHGVAADDYLAVASSNRLYEDSGDLIIEADNGDIDLSPNDKATYNGVEIATKNDLPKKQVIATFNTSLFTVQSGGNYAAEDIPLHGFIAGSDLIIITWDNCFAICPIPATEEADGRVCAAMWNANGEAQTIRIRYAVTDNNTLLQISLQGGFTPPSNHTAYVICYKLITQ